uniref:Heterokaryon incompatibility protein C n=1 Tax=Puccinia cf. psidii AE-2014 TaxID=1505670 RepID=A0A060IHP9_9BASI|nr:heterokaryon incompatibility protein C [Puccinia cf. psidii AE-2014]
MTLKKKFKSLSKFEFISHKPSLIIFLVLVVLVNPSIGFGAGNIPSYAYLEHKAFRHGDIESVLSELAKKAAGGILGSLAIKKFNGLDIKRVYFGNWLRDYSQAMDVAGLSKLAKQTIINLVMALGFLAHGYATDEFEVTEERLGVYLPVEHIDNPKGYNDGHDARMVHPGLRGPIDPQELQIDPRTGMKNYIANEFGTWDTSAACVRRTLLKCIQLGRRAKNGRQEDYHESYRLLGSAVSVLAFFFAHSNWCELSLKRLGYSQVFCHVGDACLIDTPSGRAPPLVTGVFGAADFLHSLLGEATDHISEASVSDLTKAIDTARNTSGTDPSSDALRSLLFEMPSGGGDSLSRELDGLSDIRRRSSSGSGFDPAQLTPQELHSTLWKVLKFRDNVCKSIEKTIEKIPGLSTLTEKIGNTVNKFVFTTLEPYLKPLMQSATGVLQTGSSAVINKQEQYEVFENPYADDPTHSLLSKDHFGLILNEPAGNLAKIVVKHTVKSVVQAWGSTDVDPQQSINKILEAFHHPYFVDGSSDVQKEMGEYMRDWIGKMPSADRDYVLNALTKDSVRRGANKRRGFADTNQQGCCGSHGSSTFGQHMQGMVPSSSQLMGNLTSHIPGSGSCSILESMAENNRNYETTQISGFNFDAVINTYEDNNHENHSMPSIETSGFSMPEVEHTISPAGYGPGPGGFAIPQPETNDFYSSRSDSLAFSPHRYTPGQGFGVNNHNNHPANFSLEPPQPAGWPQQGMRSDFTHTNQYGEHRPPPPLSWSNSSEQVHPSQAWQPSPEHSTHSYGNKGYNGFYRQ